MLHKLTDPRLKSMPESCISSKSVYWGLLFSNDGLAHLHTWEERMWEWHCFWRTLPKQGAVHKPAIYIIKIDELSDGSGVWMRYPTRYGWTDYIWSLEHPFITVDGREITKVSYYDIAAILWAEKRANPIGFELIARLLQEYTETAVKPDPKVLKAYPSVTGNDMERIFAAIGIGYIEQFNKNHIGLNMQMSYGLYPPTRERIAQSIDMRNGILTLFYSLHQALTHHMDMTLVVDMVKTRWQYSSKDKDHGEKFYDSHGYLSSMNEPAHIVFERTKELVFAYGKDNADIFLDDLTLAPSELQIHIHEEHNDQDSLEFWFNSDIKPFANSCDATCAYFDHGYVRLDGNGAATVCLYQEWTEQAIAKTINRQQQMIKHISEE